MFHAVICATLFIKGNDWKDVFPHILTQSTIKRQLVRDEILHWLRTSEKCYDVICIGPQDFQGLCDILRRNDDLQDTQCATVEEQVAKFLHILSQKNYTVSFFLCCFGETISCHFHNVLRSIIMLENQFLWQLDGNQVPVEILHSNKFNPYFKVNISWIYYIFDSSLV